MNERKFAIFTDKNNQTQHVDVEKIESYSYSLHEVRTANRVYYPKGNLELDKVTELLFNMFEEEK